MQHPPTALSVEEKNDIISLIEAGGSPSSIAEQFNTNDATISIVYKNRARMKDTASGKDSVEARKIKKACQATIERLLLGWTEERRRKGIHIKSSDLRDQAVIISIQNKLNFKCSRNWIRKFRIKHNISEDAPAKETHNSSVETDPVADWLVSIYPNLQNSYEEHPKCNNNNQNNDNINESNNSSDNENLTKDMESSGDSTENIDKESNMDDDNYTNPSMAEAMDAAVVLKQFVDNSVNNDKVKKRMSSVYEVIKDMFTKEMKELAE